MLKTLVGVIFYITLAVSIPVKRDIDFASAFSSAVNATWDTFWDSDKEAWNANDPDCGSDFSYPSVWIAAVASKAIADTNDKDKLYSAAQSLIDNYLNSDNWFSATTAKDDDVYTDDNAQVMWVLIKSYQIAGATNHLTVAQKVMDNIMGETEQNGGVKWSISGTYLASISTAETALAAMRLYALSQDKSLLKFAENAVSFLLGTLQDPSDKLLYDGLDTSDGKVNKGKLTYSVGTAISALSLLYKYTDNSSYLDSALELATAAMNTKGAFFTDGYFNNQLEYVHLLYEGIVDLISIDPPSSTSQSESYQTFISELLTQAAFTYDYLQVGDGVYYHDAYTYTEALYSKYSSKLGGSKSYSPDASNFCGGDVNGTPKKSLMDTASAAQEFYDMTVVAV